MDFWDPVHSGSLSFHRACFPPVLGKLGEAIRLCPLFLLQRETVSSWLCFDPDGSLNGLLMEPVVLLPAWMESVQAY